MKEFSEDFLLAAKEAAEEQTAHIVREALEFRFPNLTEQDYEDYFDRISLVGNPEFYLGFWLDRVEGDGGELIVAMTAPEVMPEKDGFRFSAHTYVGIAAEEFIKSQTVPVTMDTSVGQ